MIMQRFSEVYSLILFLSDRMSPTGLKTNEEELEVRETGGFVVVVL